MVLANKFFDYMAAACRVAAAAHGEMVNWIRKADQRASRLRIANTVTISEGDESPRRICSRSKFLKALVST